MNHNAIETILGAVVLVIAGFFLVFALGAADMKRVSGYELYADFAKADGISPGLDVKVSGVKVGSVSKMELNPETYMAKVTMSVEPSIKLPEDSTARVASESLLGGKYLSLEPGAADEMLKPGAKIERTQGSVNLEELLGKFMFSTADKSNDKKSEAAPAPVSSYDAADPAANSVEAPSTPTPADAGFTKDY